MSKFNVGDHVEVVDSGRGYTLSVGDQMTVTDTNWNNQVRVRFGSNFGYGTPGQELPNWYSEDRFELVTPVVAKANKSVTEPKNDVFVTKFTKFYKETLELLMEAEGAYDPGEVIDEKGHLDLLENLANSLGYRVTENAEHNVTVTLVKD